MIFVQIQKINIKYTKQAKKLDVRRLKHAMWKILTKDVKLNLLALNFKIFTVLLFFLGRGERRFDGDFVKCGGAAGANATKITRKNGDGNCFKFQATNAAAAVGSFRDDGKKFIATNCFRLFLAYVQ